MIHIIKNISGSNLTLGTITLVPNEELEFYNDTTGEFNNVDDIITSINSSSDNINEYFFNNRVEYIEDGSVKTDQEFYIFWNEFVNITYPDLLNIIPISRNSFDQNITGFGYNATSGVLSLDQGRSIITEEEQNRINETFGWGDHNTSGYISTNISSGFVSVRNTDSTTNLNITGVGVRVPITGLTNQISSDFQVNGDGIRVTNGGLILCSATVYINSTAQRPNLDLSFEIDNVVQDAGFAHGYIRATSGHNEASITMIQWLNVADNQTVYIRSRGISTTGTVTMTNNRSLFEIFKPVESAAKGEKGDKGDDGVNAFNFLDGTVAPSSGLGIIGDIYLNRTTNEFYRKDTATDWTFLTILAGGISDNQSIVPIWAEENGGLTNNNAQWSFGNGSVGLTGVTIPFNGKVISMTFHAEVAGTSNSEVEMLVNDLSTPISVVKPANNKSAFNNFINSPYDINQGDYIGFRTLLGGGATDARVCVWLLLDNNDILNSSSSNSTGSSNIITFSDVNNLYVESTSSTYQAITRFIYDGTTNTNTILNIKSNIYIDANDSSKSCDIRIFDATNSNTIAEFNNITSTDDLNIIDLGTISSLPTLSSIFEVQVKQNNNAILRCSNVIIGY